MKKHEILLTINDIRIRIDIYAEAPSIIKFYANQMKNYE